jgi:hypothetical protein
MDAMVRWQSEMAKRRKASKGRAEEEEWEWSVERQRE